MPSFGFSLGVKKTKGSSTTNMSKNEVTNQSQTGTKTAAETGSQTGTQSGTSAGQTATQQQEQATQTGTKSNTQTGTQQAFSDDVLNTIESLIGGVADRAGTSGRVVDDAIASLGNFDPTGYVDSSVAAAESREQSSLDELFGSLADTAGSSLGNNSMAALLANRAMGDAAARIEGVRATATGQAETINRENQMGAVGAASAQDNLLLGFLEQLKGGRATTTQAGTEATAGTTASTGSATGTTAEQNATQSATQTTQNLVEALSQLLSGTTSTTGTENVKSKGSTIGAGLSLSG